MAFTVSDFRDLVSLLRQHPEWREELRPLLLSEEVLRLPVTVDRLALRLEELAEAQKRTELRVEELAQAQQATAKAVSNLKRVIGVTIEEEAAAVLRVVLENKGYRVLGEALNVRWDGDVDIAMSVLDPQGQPMSALVEAKARLIWRDVAGWAKRVRSPGYQDRLEAAKIQKPYLAYVYGMRVDIASRQAAEQFQMGLLPGRGEELPPLIIT